MSDLKINLQKSELILVREVEDVGRLRSLVGCKVGRFSTPTSYFILALGAPHKSCVCMG